MSHKPKVERVNVTKTFLPPKEEYEAYVCKIWENRQLTNNGPLSNEFESAISTYLNMQKDQFTYVANGTLALQLALRALGVEKGEVITTPFSYVATTSAILWEKCDPVFVDINKETLNIDPEKIEAAITDKTKAILAVHVFGNPCDIDAIDSIAKKHNLKVIYDAAHAFGVKYKGKSLLSYGDISTCSFHATKIFHTIEGGGIYSSSIEVASKIELYKRFGHNGDNHIQLGINAKPSEFHAAMGLTNLKYIDAIIDRRKHLTKLYDNHLPASLERQVMAEMTQPNFSYYPIIFESEAKLLKAAKALEAKNIFARRYFHPSLNKLPYLTSTSVCETSESISSRILCLPLYYDLQNDDVIKVCEIIEKSDAS